MPGTMIAAAAVLVIVVLGVAGDYFLKLASGKQAALSSPEFAAGALLYILSAAGFMFAMRHISLTTMGVWYAVLTVLMLTALGVFVFEERLTARELAGILMAFGALGLTGRFA